MKCKYCELDKDTVILRPAMTAYHWDKDATNIDPNADIPLCEICWDNYAAYWQDQWDDLYASLYASL
jgi:hypothetical protein